MLPGFMSILVAKNVIFSHFHRNSIENCDPVSDFYLNGCNTARLVWTFDTERLEIDMRVFFFNQGSLVTKLSVINIPTHLRVIPTLSYGTRVVDQYSLLWSLTNLICLLIIYQHLLWCVQTPHEIEEECPNMSHSHILVLRGHSKMTSPQKWQF